jgi:hypothetical protein
MQDPQQDERTGPGSRGSAGPDAAGTTDARSAADPAHPAEGPADAAGPAADHTADHTTDGTADGTAGVRRPASVGTAPDIRGASSSAQAADTGAAQGGTTGERDDLGRTD